MTTNIDQHPHPLEGRLESECGNFKYPMECAVLSAAISLKRIADQLDGSGGDSTRTDTGIELVRTTTTLREENERLNTALGDLVSWFAHPIHGIWVIPRDADNAVAFARQALQGDTHD